MDHDTIPRSSTVREFAARYGLAPNTVYLWGKQGRLKVTKVGPRAVRILRNDEKKWLRASEARTEQQALERAERLALERAERLAERQRLKQERAECRAKRQAEQQAERQRLKLERAERLALERAERQVKRQAEQQAERQRLRQERAERQEWERTERQAARLRLEQEHNARQVEVLRQVFEHEAKRQAELLNFTRQHPESLAELLTKAEADDGVYALGLRPSLFRRLTGLGVYCVRDLRAHPQPHLIPALLDKKSLGELRVALAETQGLGLDDLGRLYPLAEAAA